MKIFFAVLSISLLSLATIVTANANADVVKPASTIDTATGVIKIQNTEFDYSVRDRGWMTTGTADGAKVSLEASKTFLIQYQSKGTMDKATASFMWPFVRGDAEQKCRELGEIEYADQIAKLDPSYTPSYSAKIVNTSRQLSNVNFVSLVAVCEVEVSATK